MTTTAPRSSDARLPWHIFLILVAAGLAAAGILLGVVLWVAQAADRRAAQDAAQLARAGLTALEDRLEISVVDHAWAPAERVEAVLSLDDGRVNAEIGAGVVEGAAFDLLAIVQPNGAIRYAWRGGGAAASDPSIVQPRSARAMAALVADAALSPVTARRAYAIVDGRVILLAAARMTPYGAADAPAGELPVLIGGLWMTGGVLRAMGAQILLDDLRLDRFLDHAPADLGDAIPLADPSGAPVAHLRWDRPHPGSAIVMRAAPVLALLMVGLVLAFAGLGRRTGAQARQIIRERGLARRAARTDLLTGLLNRSGLVEAEGDDRISGAIAEGRAAVIYIDLDGFKQLNDRIGHEGGDEALRVTARRLRAAAREGDTVARVGGDEFVVLLIDPDAEAAARRIAAAIREACAEPFEMAGEFHVAPPSIGVALAAGASDLDDLVTRADAAMYAAKQSRETDGVFYSAELGADRRKQRVIEARLRHGIEAAEAGRSPFALAYQPILRTATGEMDNAEALLRWHDGELGTVPPGAFIPVAESFGLVPSLGLLALRQACADMARWPGLKVTVNVSAVQLRDRDFPGQVLEVARAAGIAPRRLTLELTETALVEMPHEAKGRMDALRAMGFRLALDDFGTGFSSISYLKRFTFDGLKIDRSFVSALGEDLRADMLFQSMVQLSKAFRLDVVAEGVETERQERIVRLADCTYEQGFLHARPMPFDEMRARYAGAVPARRSAARAG